MSDIGDVFEQATAAFEMERESKPQAINSWVIITDPGCVPDRKGPFLSKEQLKSFLKEAMAARPYSHLIVLGCYDRQPIIEDGTQCLEMMDARSAPTSQKHRDRLKSIRLPVPTSAALTGKERADG